MNEMCLNEIWMKSLNVVRRLQTNVRELNGKFTISYYLVVEVVEVEFE